MFTTTAIEQERCLAIFQKKGSCVKLGKTCNKYKCLTSDGTSGGPKLKNWGG